VAQAEQAALFQLDLEALEQAEVPVPDSPTQGQPLKPEAPQIEDAVIPFPTEPVKTADPKGVELSARVADKDNIPNPPMPEKSAIQPLSVGAISDRPVDTPPQDGLETQVPAQLAATPNPADPSGVDVPKTAPSVPVDGPLKDLPQAMPKPELATGQTPPQSVSQNALAQTETPRAQDAQAQPSRQDLAPTLPPPTAPRKQSTGHETAPAVQANLANQQPAMAKRQAEIPFSPKAAPSQSATPLVTPLTGQSSAVLETYARPAATSVAPLAPASAQDARAPKDFDTPLRDAPARPTATLASVHAGGPAGHQMIQAPLTKQSMTVKDLAEPEPLAALSALQPSSPLSPTPPSTPQPVTPAQTSYAVHQITAQITAELGAKSGRDIEVRLDPEELGRVRITVHPREAGLFIALAVERPETLDLLRKNADELMSNLQEFDLSGATLEFSQEDDSPSSDTQHNGPEETPLQFSATPHPVSAPPAADGRLDLRL
jgi:flagellar hook-length control protein FliK